MGFTKKKKKKERKKEKKMIKSLRAKAKAHAADPLPCLGSYLPSMCQSCSHLRISGNLFKIKTNPQIVLLLWE